MKVSGKPVSVMIPDPQVGDETKAAAALILMDEETDVLRGTGWYWTRTGPAANPEDPRTWRTAVIEGRGPLRSAELALQAAETASVESFDAASRLDECAEVVRAGEIDPTIESVVTYMRSGMETDRVTREAASDSMRSARGIHAEEGRQALDEMAQNQNDADELRITEADLEGVAHIDPVQAAAEEEEMMRQLLENADPVERDFLKEVQEEMNEIHRNSGAPGKPEKLFDLPEKS